MLVHVELECAATARCSSTTAAKLQASLRPKSSIDRIKDRDNDSFLGVLEKNKLLVVSMQIRFKTLTCKFKSQLDGDVTLEPKIWINIPGRVIQGLEVHEATSSRRGWWGLLGNWLWSQCICLLNWLIDSQGCSESTGVLIKGIQDFSPKNVSWITMQCYQVLSIGVINYRVH